jgi:polyhydroxyalkanoate synthesis repressor PhaR
MTDNQTRLIKKYPNRRLYDTQTSTYITLSDVKQLVLAGENFTVLDAKTSEDLTRSILLQIILDEESGGAPMFSAPMLSQMIRFYGNAMQGMMGDYLEKNIHAFTEMQNAFQEQSKKLVEGKASFPTADAWTQMIQGQNPMMQNLMGGYLEQSKTMMMQMQEQMQKNAQSMFQGFQFPPAGSGDAAKKDSE